jgi:hypothetical protein
MHHTVKSDKKPLKKRELEEKGNDKRMEARVQHEEEGEEEDCPVQRETKSVEKTTEHLKIARVRASVQASHG